MSEYTNYFATRSEKLDSLKVKFLEKGITAVIDDIESNDWLLFYCPYRFSDDGLWSTVKEILPNILEIYVEEDGKRWSLRGSINEKERFFEFYSENDTLISEEDEKFLSELTGVSFENFKNFLKMGAQYDFCKAINLPYLELMDQKLLTTSLKNGGGVILASSLS